MMEKEQRRNFLVSGAPRKAYHDAEGRFTVRVRIAVPQGGFGRQFSDMHAWLDDACGKASWASAPAGLVGVANDAVAFYFDDAANSTGLRQSLLLRLSVAGGRP
jgi:hypothetical protein